MVADRETGFLKPKCDVYANPTMAQRVKPAYWFGKLFSTFHVLSFLNEDYQTIFNVLQTDNEVLLLLGPYPTALKNKAMEQL